MKVLGTNGLTQPIMRYISIDLRPFLVTSKMHSLSCYKNIAQKLNKSLGATLAMLQGMSGDC